MLKYFKNFKKYAFRLELLQRYDVEDEKESFLKFIDSGKVLNINSDWYKLIKESIKRNVVIQRVHVVKLPLSDYIKFEVGIYKKNIKAGEEVSLIDLDQFNKLNLGINFDFWLFDDEIVLKMNYDKNGKFLNFEEIHENIDKFVNIKNILLSQSKLL